MSYCYTALIAGLLAAGTAFPANSPGKVTIRWHGQSFFDIQTSKGTRIVIDPHALEAYGRQSVPADLILVSHFHNDHTQVGVVPNYARAKILYGLKMIGKKPRGTRLTRPSAMCTFGPSASTMIMPKGWSAARTPFLSWRRTACASSISVISVIS